jgi:hypothetical protein
LTDDEMLETYQCFHSAFERLAPGPWRNHQNPIHDCSNACFLFNHREVYICCSNGNMHVCNEMACDRAIVTLDGRSCPITGKVFDAELQFTFSDGVQCASYSQRRSSKITSSFNSSKCATNNNNNNKSDDSMQLKSARRRGGGTSVSDGSMRVFTINDIQHQIEPLVTKLLPSLATTHVPRVVKSIEQTYQRLMQVGIHAEHSSSLTYTLPMHVVIVLHLMASGGMRYLGDDFVLMDKAVQEAMPGRGLQTLLIAIKRNVRQHTDMIHAFTVYMDKWCRTHGVHSMISTTPSLSPF